MGLDSIPVKRVVPAGYGARDNHVHSVRLEVHLFDLSLFEVRIFLVQRLGRLNLARDLRGTDLHLPAIPGRIELPEQLRAVDIGFGQQPLVGIVGELEIHQRHEDRRIKTRPRRARPLLVIAHAVCVRVAFDDAKSPAEGGAEQRGAHLAHSAAHALDCAIPVDNERLCIAGVQADVTQHIRHRKRLARSDQQSVKRSGGGGDVLDPCRA